jgi:hypothetical protein
MALEYLFTPELKNEYGLLDVDFENLPYTFKYGGFIIKMTYNQIADYIFMELLDTNGDSIFPKEKLSYAVPMWKNYLIDKQSNLNKAGFNYYIYGYSLDGNHVEITLESLKDESIFIVTQLIKEG